MNADAKIEQIVINSPYVEPVSHWQYEENESKFVRVSGRRKSGYLIHDKDKEIFIEIELVNKIRPLVKDWRESGFPGVTGVTRKLLEHWRDSSLRYNKRLFFCQLEAAETLIFLNEAKPDIEIPNDGGNFQRICTKLCTGGGKTIVMAMLAAYMILNSVSYPRDKRFSKNILILAPNLTVKKRLEVLKPGEGQENYYSEFSIVPPEMKSKMNQGRIIIHNWQALKWETDEEIKKRKSIDKRGAKSDRAYLREILKEIPDAKNILVINDEAHHAYRYKDTGKKRVSKEEKDEQERATVWISGLDRINKAAGILKCYDFSATPYVPGGDEKKSLFSWIVSDFSLSDGIESGLVKTPYVVVRDDAAPDSKNYRSKLYHIYANDEVKSDLTKSQPPEAELPDKVRNAYMILAADWKKKYDQWLEHNKKTPPVMITVANRTETAARIEYMFEKNAENFPGELCDEKNILRIDSQKLKSSSEKESDFLRLIADTVGKEGQPGEQKCNIISVGMLSEGWDAKTVTHIMGLRAFSSQLLCEQVVGRGLRRTSYELEEGRELFQPEYVNVFGVPFDFLPFEEHGSEPPDEKIKFKIEALDSRREFEISWPNVTRLEYVMTQKLSLDFEKIPALELDATDTRTSAELAPLLNGRPDLTKLSMIELEEIYSKFRFQEIIFKSANKVYDVMESKWQAEGVKIKLIGQVINLTEKYLKKIKIFPEEFSNSETFRKIVTAFNMEKIIKHIWEYIQSENTEKILPVLDEERKERSTGDMPVWYTSRENYITEKSHINRCVFDSTWEASTAYQLEKNPDVKAWAKNDHLGFYINYISGGVTRRYIPDFLIKFEDGTNLILETKGIETEQDEIKFEALEDWVTAVNGLKIFGQWSCEKSKNPKIKI